MGAQYEHEINYYKIRGHSHDGVNSTKIDFSTYIASDFDKAAIGKMLSTYLPSYVPRGVVAFRESGGTALSQSVGTSESDVQELSVPFTLDTTRRYKLTFKIWACGSQSDTTAEFYFNSYVSTTKLDQWRIQANISAKNPGSGYGVSIIPPGKFSSGSYVAKITANMLAGTGNVYTSGTLNGEHSYIMIEDIGGI